MNPYISGSHREARWGPVLMVGGIVGALGALLTIDWIGSNFHDGRMLTIFLLDQLSMVPSFLGDILSGIFSWQFGAFVLSLILMAIAVVFGFMAFLGFLYTGEWLERKRKGKHGRQATSSEEEPV